MDAKDMAVTVGMAVARQVFNARGNHTEAHLSEGQLGAIVALGIQRSGQPELVSVAESVVFICDSGNVEQAQLALMETSPLVDEARAALKKARFEQ